MGDKRRVPLQLRLITYLAPGLPVQFFETISHYLEEKMQCPVYLIYESRWTGPPADRADPFTLDHVDLAFINPEPFMKLMERAKDKVELLPVAPLYPHPKSDNKPVYFSDVIIHSDNCEKFREFKEMRGVTWAYSNPSSTSGVLTTLRQLKQMGESVMFFGHIIQSGSHAKSIQMVADKTVEAAAINSTLLSYHMKEQPDLAEKLHIVTSWGPLPVQPIVVNSRMSEELKKEITKHLLNMHQEKAWRIRMEAFTMKKFVPVDMAAYREGEELRKDVSKLSIEGTIYY